MSLVQAHTAVGAAGQHALAVGGPVERKHLVCARLAGLGRGARLREGK